MQLDGRQICSFNLVMLHPTTKIEVSIDCYVWEVC